MASRLTVIISQAAVRQSQVVEIEESLLTELMLAAGLDATLIGPLVHVHPASTDYLCLSGFTQSLALVCDLSTAEVTEQWQRLQLPGQVVSLDPRSAGAVGTLTAGRRIYHLPTRLGTGFIVQQLRQLLADKAVQTVSVALPVSAKETGGVTMSLPVLARPAQRPTVAAANLQAAGHTQSAAASGAGSGAASATGSGAVEGPSGHADAEWPDLERLVDEFDSLDI